MIVLPDFIELLDKCDSDSTNRARTFQISLLSSISTQLLFVNSTKINKYWSIVLNLIMKN